MISKYDELAKKHNLSRRTHSFNMDKDGYLTVTTEVATVDNIPRSELFQNVFKCQKSEMDACIQVARELCTGAFLAHYFEESTDDAKPVVAPEEVYVAPTEPVKKKRTRKKKVEVVASVVAVPAIVAEEETGDDGLGLLGEEDEPVPVTHTYEKGNKVHGKYLSTLLVKEYGSEWQNDEKVKVIVRGLVAAIKDVVPVVDSKGEMLPTFPVFVLEYLKKAAA